jgi:parvulin-like peptidyl-prolyl isomerase
MAKSTAKVKAVPRTRRAHRDEAEHWNRILIVGGVIAVIAIAIGVIAYGWYATQIKPLGKTVLQVGDMKFSLGTLERRLHQDLPSDLSGRTPASYVERTMQDLQREALLTQGSADLKINVTDDDVVAAIRTQGGLAADVEPRLYAAEYSRQLRASGLHESEFREKLKASLYETKVSQYFTYLAPAVAPQVRARWIVTDKQDTATAALLRLATGEDFTAIATDLSLDTVGSTKQADLNWTVQGTFGYVPQKVEDYLFSSELGKTSPVIADSGFFYIAQVLDRDNNRAVTDQQKQQIGTRDMNKWLTGLATTIEVTRHLSLTDAAKAYSDAK